MSKVTQRDFIIFANTKRNTFMKRIHFISLVILLSSVFTFTSCLDSDNESSFDWSGYVTLDSYMGYTLKPDFSDYSFIPSNPEVLKIVDKDNKPTGEYMERGYVLVKFAEGEVFPQEGKNSYNVSIFDASLLFTKEMSMYEPEIEENSNSIYQLETTYGKAWVSNGYFNVPFIPTYDKRENIKLEDFDLFVDDVKDNILYLRLNHSITKIDNPIPTENISLLISFRHHLTKSYLLTKYPQLQPDEKDIIKVKIIAKGPNKDMETEAFKDIETEAFDMLLKN